jgi:hypothetical protein
MLKDWHLVVQRWHIALPPMIYIDNSLVSFEICIYSKFIKHDHNDLLAFFSFFNIFKSFYIIDAFLTI